MENRILQVQEIVGSSNSIKGINLGLESTRQSWERMQEVLKGLAFNWDFGKDPLHSLGFSLEEGPPPHSLANIQKRWELAELFLRVGFEIPNLDTFTGDMRSVHDIFMRAKDTSISMLPHGQNKKVKGKGGAFGRWRVAGYELVDFLETLLPGARNCFQLCEVQDFPRWKGKVVERKQVMSIHELLLRGEGVDQVFHSMRDQHFVV